MERQRNMKCDKLEVVGSQMHLAAKVRQAQASKASVLVEDVAALFRCGKCLDNPLKPPIYTCSSGHLTCSSCFQKSKFECHNCKGPLVGRNHLLEEVVRGLSTQTCAALLECSPPTRKIRSEESLQLTLQDPSHLEKLEKARMESQKGTQTSRDYMSSPGSSDESLHRTSHRPVMCPYPCGRMVTCSGLFPHFEFYHPSVHVRTTTRGKEEKFKVNYDDVMNVTDHKCLVFYNVRLDTDKAVSNAKWTASSMLKVTKTSQEMLRHGCFLSFLTVGRLDNEDDNGWALVIWASSVYDIGRMSYKVTATSEYTPCSVSFSGPLVCLHQSQRPEDVYSTGECLVIQPLLLYKMRFDVAPVQLTISFDSNLPPPAMASKLSDLNLLFNDENLFDFP